MQDAKVKAIREVRVSELFKYFYLNLLHFLLSLAYLIVAIIVLKDIHIAFLISSIALITLIVIFTIKRFFIGCVLMYKAYAPMKIRNKCRYEPCCSSYMILAVEKYGLIKGFIKGIKRIKRCKPPYGGVDYP